MNGRPTERHRRACSPRSRAATAGIAAAVGLCSPASAREAGPPSPDLAARKLQGWSGAPLPQATTGDDVRAEAPADLEANLVRARDDFQLGTSLVKQGQWSEALAAFERAGALRPHPITRFNIAVCQRALGRYMQARETFARALAENQAAGGTQLPETFLADTSAYMLQMEGLLATLTLAIQPASVRIAVDGRPLAQAQSATDRPRFVAGTRDAGPGETAPSGPFDVELDPGAHVITLSRKGYQDVVLNRTLAPGSKANFPVALSLLPATLHIRADKPGAVVTVDGLDVGVAPVDLSRPAGTYRVVLRKPGLLPYETKLAAGPGQHVYVTAPLVEDKPSVLKKWWFWTAAAAVVAGAVGTTYAVTRPEPTQTAPNGGGLGWAQKLP